MSLEAFTAGVETAVDVAGIERQLRQLWEKAGPTVTRASLFNLVAVCGSAEERERATRVIATVTLRHPCRAMVVTTQPDHVSAELSATVTALCHLAGGGGKQVCCELIHVTATGRSVERLGSAVLPLLESDLPTVMWHLGNICDASGRQPVMAERVIFDGAECAGVTSLRDINELVRSRPRVQHVDLAWTRLSLWRKLLADCFDDPHAAAALAGMEQLNIVHGCGAGAEWRARLIAGWVAAKLGWSAAEMRQRVVLECREDQDATALGLVSLELSGSGASVQVRKNFGECTATSCMMMPAVCGLPRRQAFELLDDAQLLSQELDHARRHPVYEQALALAAQWQASQTG